MLSVKPKSFFNYIYQFQLSQLYRKLDCDSGIVRAVPCGYPSLE